jgi:hypothetical protein
MWFDNNNAPLPTGVITASEGLELDIVTSYKYLGVWLDGTLSFSQHISKLRLNLDFFSSIIITLLSTTCQNKLESVDYPTHARFRGWKL